MSCKKMSDSEVQRKLNQLAKIANELAEEAERRYGEEGELYYEAEGRFNFMKHNRVDCRCRRQDGVVMVSEVHARMECGAW
ncbi:hypothetical protein [Kistimonas asteriae]|uniref:hypothetical protein n=1 Tax=Kistimonas asteriae TaxID=517724 RepID=UPI001BAA76B7|nr:hypothetical protein [Kistimonas asteriae]